MPRWFVPASIVFVVTLQLMGLGLDFDGREWVETTGEGRSVSLSWDAFDATGTPFFEATTTGNAQGEWLVWGDFDQDGPTGATGLLRCDFDCYGDGIEAALHTLRWFNRKGIRYRLVGQPMRVRTDITEFMVQKLIVDSHRRDCIFFLSARHIKDPHFTVYVGWYCAPAGSSLPLETAREAIESLRETG